MSPPNTAVKLCHPERSEGSCGRRPHIAAKPQRFFVTSFLRMTQKLETLPKLCHCEAFRPWQSPGIRSVNNRDFDGCTRRLPRHFVSRNDITDAVSNLYRTIFPATHMITKKLRHFFVPHFLFIHMDHTHANHLGRQ